ncbi:unnamed protein product [Euphydryas editha]|uniref:Uncharacterized protein n=1 Tax=Euphydryas editha TaxID=104508 RepID=A0AAU9U2T7_EUPED|nr:unnamed protein product [Euphydryas editha]
MSQVTIYLTVALSLILIINIECAVKKREEIPLNKDTIMKIIVNEDSDGDSETTIKISTSHKKKSDKILHSNHIDKFVWPASEFIPELNFRSGVSSKKCPKGKERFGQACVEKIKDTEDKRR